MVLCDCGTEAHFNFDGEEKGVRCSKHKLLGMVDVAHPACAKEGCRTQPTFNFPTEKKGIYCAKHKEAGMVSIQVTRECPTCREKGDKKRPYYNFRGEKFGLYCAVHKEDGMINVVNKLCEHEPTVADPRMCDKRALYNYLGETQGRFCFKHKLADMIDVKNPTCEVAGCPHAPIYDLPGGKGRFCKEHIQTNMVDVKNAKKRANEASGKLTDDKKHRKCHCNKTATFGKYGGPPERCAKHKDDDMIDVRHKLCEICVELIETRPHPTQASYGLPGTTPSRCKLHLLEGMVLKPKTICSHKLCKEPAQYGIVIPIHCILHKTELERSLIGQVCQTCQLVDILDEKGRCDTCRPENVSKFKLAKQRELRVHLEKNGLGDFEIYDRIVDGGVCGLERPDFVYKCLYLQLVLECDEDGGHKRRAEECECTRMVNISQTFGTPTLFIRYNPDPYIGPDGIRKTPTVARRIKLLKRCIDHFRTAKPDHFLSVLHLYYDGFDPDGPIVAEPILKFEK